MAEQVAIHKTENWTFFIDIADKSAPVCTRTRRCIFPGYIDENAIQNKFPRVPPLPDGFVCKVHAIAVEMELSNLTALFLYEHTLSTRIQKRRKLSVSYAIVNESDPTRGTKGFVSTL